MEKTDAPTNPNDLDLRAKIARLQAVGQLIYQSIIATNVPTSLGLAARAKTPFESLPVDDLVALAQLAAECVRRGLVVAPATINAFAVPAAAGSEVVQPDAIEAGRRPRSAKRETSVSDRSVPVRAPSAPSESEAKPIADTNS